MDLEVRHLRLVTAVADVGSLTRASERLNLTQSALSHQLRDIESRLGTALFLRVGKRMVLTPAGERLLGSARDVLDRLDKAEEDVRALGRDRAGMLRITTECYTCYHWLPPLLTRFRRRFPRVEIRIDVDATPRPIATLLEGRIDLAIVSSPVRDRRFAVRPLFEDEVVVLLAPGHALAQRPHVRPIDLANETLILYPPKEESRVLQQVLLPAGISPHVQEVALTEAIFELVKAGLGVAALAQWAARPLVESGALAARRLTARGLHRRWSAVMPKELARMEYVSEFVALLSSHSPVVQKGCDGQEGRERLVVREGRVGRGSRVGRGGQVDRARRV
jgi:LysR family transcriptional regulator for metE and metH